MNRLGISLTPMYSIQMVKLQYSVFHLPAEQLSTIQILDQPSIQMVTVIIFLRFLIM